MRNCFFVFILIVVIFLIGPFLILLNINQTVLNPEYLKNGLTKTKVYEQILKVDPADIEKLFSKGNSQKGGGEGFDKTMISSITNSIPPAALRDAFEKNFDRAVSDIFYRGSKMVTFEVGDLKSAVLSNRPSPDVAILAGMINDTYTVNVPPQLAKYGGLFARGRLYLGIFAAVLGLLILILLLLARSWKTRFRTSSLVSLIGGLFALTLYVISFVVALPFQKIQLPPSIFQLLFDLVEYFKSSFFRLFLIEGIVLVALAIALFALGFLFKIQTAPQAPNNTTKKK